MHVYPCTKKHHFLHTRGKNYSGSGPVFNTSAPGFRDRSARPPSRRSQAFLGRTDGRRAPNPLGLCPGIQSFPLGCRKLQVSARSLAPPLHRTPPGSCFSKRPSKDPFPKEPREETNFGAEDATVPEIRLQLGQDGDNRGVVPKPPSAGSFLRPPSGPPGGVWRRKRIPRGGPGAPVWTQRRSHRGGHATPRPATGLSRAAALPKPAESEER